MFRIDKAIYDADAAICKNIDRFDSSERGLLSQNILSQLRNLVEYIAKKVYAQGNDIDPNDDSQRSRAINFIKGNGQYRFLSKFHSLLQKSVSHYTVDEDGSERLMLKYYEYLLRIKSFLSNEYGMEILSNISDFPLDLDPHFAEYYEKIAGRINSGYAESRMCKYDDRCYIQKIKPFFVGGRIYYEVTFTMANDKVSKFDRIIAFTAREISDYYAVKFSIRNDEISIMGRTMPIQIIDSWQVSIRPCELDHFAEIFGVRSGMKSNYKEYQELMNFLTSTKMSLVELVLSTGKYYEYVKSTVLERAKAITFFNVLDECRNLILSDAPGSNTVRYLLQKLNNNVLKAQYSSESCGMLSNLNLQYGCIPFDQMPFSASLIHHNPKLRDLLACIDDTEKECEFLARTIRNNTEHKGILFTPISELSRFSDLDSLIREYNSRIYYKHTGRKLKKYNDYVYIAEYADDSAVIVKKLSELTAHGIGGYRASVDSWLRNYEVDCPEKKDALLRMFEDSTGALIYGSAGTGKSTLINHISSFFSDRDKIFLANTHPAVENMRRKVKTSKSEFKTIRSFLSGRNSHTSCDVLVIDECSTVSNHDMRAILESAEYKLLILVGDVFQIESIMFGNWFSIARFFVPEKATIELTKPYRTTSESLLNVWERVRELDDAILEPLVKYEYIQNLDESIFEHTEKDEIILCLNYDGLYGINNINRFLQGSNPSPVVEWGVTTYKVGDPILFNESDRFSPLIYNNMKGQITAITPEEKRIWFEVELDIAINEWDAEWYDFELIGLSDDGNSIIGFWVDKYRSTDDDNDSSSSLVPFQVAYAVSIHKAQGLEYKSVKIIITNEIEELITHNIFYTAITRAKEKLKIYWTPESEQHVLESLEKRNYNRDAYLLKSLFSL